MGASVNWIDEDDEPVVWEDVEDENAPTSLVTSKYDIDFENQPDPEDPWYKRLADSFGRGLAIQSQVSAGGGAPAVPLHAEIGKSFASGGTLGLSENIPGMKPIDASRLPEGEREGVQILQGASDIAGSLYPLEGLFGAFNIPAKYMSNPAMGKATGFFGNVLKSAGVGATENALRSSFKGEMPDPGKMLESGAIWGALDATLQAGGAGGRAIKTLLSKNQSMAGDTGKVIQKVADRFLKEGTVASTEEIMSEVTKTLEENISKIENAPALKGRNIQKADQGSKFAEELEARRPQEPNQPHIPIEKELSEPVAEEVLDTVARRAENSTELGENVVDSISEGVNAAENEYRPRYQLATEAAGDININAFKEVGEIFENFERIGGKLKTRPQNYESTIGQLEGIMEDLGGTFERDAQQRITGRAEATHPVNVTDLMELGRRTSSMSKYGNLKPSVKDAITRANQSIKRLIRKSLKSKPDALELWKEAEKIFGEKAEIFDNKVISKIRDRNFNPEDISRFIKKPSDLQKLKKAVSPEQFKQVEREMLSKIQEIKSYDNAFKQARELRPSLSKETNELLDEILVQKKPKAKLTTSEKSQQLNKVISDSLAKPQKSESLMKMWESPRGREDIKKALKNNPNKDEIVKYLEKEKLFRAQDSMVKQSGEMNFSEMKDFLKKPSNRATLREQVGEDGLKFLDFVSDYQRKINSKGKVFNQLKNTPIKNYTPPSKQKVRDMIKNPSKRGEEILSDLKNTYERELHPNITKVSDLLEKIPQEAKTVMKLYGLMKFGPAKAVAGLASKEMFLKIAKTPRLRNAVRNALTSKSTNPYVIYGLWKIVGEEAKE